MIVGRKAFVALIAAGVLMLAPTTAGAAGGPPGPAGPGDISRPERPVADQYIVTLRDGSNGVSVEAQLLARAHGGNVLGIYQYALQGFTVSMTEAQAQALGAIPGSPPSSKTGTCTPSMSKRRRRLGGSTASMKVTCLLTGRTCTTPRAQGCGPTSSTPAFAPRPPISAGGQVSAWTPSMTEERARLRRPRDPRCRHGRGRGVRRRQERPARRRARAELRRLWTDSQVIAGVDWVTANAQKPAVANMSVGGGLSSALNSAVTNSVNSGVTYAVAAGNNGANACNYSPASTSAALTVGATTSSDARASYSNFGSCVDLFAPGDAITSDWFTSDTATNTISGTSMATPHVAGTAALYLSVNPSATPRPWRAPSPRTRR